MKLKKKRSPVFTILCDVAFQIIVALLLLVQISSVKLVQVTKVADSVPNLEEQIAGLDDALTTSQAAGRGKDKKIDELEDRLDRAEADGADKDGVIEGLNQSISKARTSAVEKDGIIEGLKRKIGKQGQEIGELTDQLGRLQPASALQLIVIVDVTGSQEPHIKRLRDTLKSLFDWLPYLAKKCKIGVLGVRDGVVFRFNLTDIKPHYSDGGRSQKALLDFLDNLNTKRSLVNHGAAIQEAIDTLGTEIKGTQQQILLLGDVGCSELDGQQGHSPKERQAAGELINKVGDWVRSGDDRTFTTVYTGVANSLDQQWFQRLAQPRVENYSTDSTDLFRFILNSIRPKGYTK